MKNFKMCKYSFLPDKKVTGEIIKRQMRIHGLTATQLCNYDGICVSARTVNSWEEGRAMPSIDVLIALAPILYCKIDDLIVPYSKFETDMYGCRENSNTEKYNYILYLIEKSIFSFLGFMERKHLDLDYIHLIKYKDKTLNFPTLLKPIEADIRAKYGDKYRTDSKVKKDEIMYEVRKRITIYTEDGTPIYEKLLQENSYYSFDLRKLNDFDRTILLTCALLIENRMDIRGFFEYKPYSKLESIFSEMNTYYLDILENSPYFHFPIEAILYVRECMLNMNYSEFLSKLKPFTEKQIGEKI